MLRGSIPQLCLLCYSDVYMLYVHLISALWSMQSLHLICGCGPVCVCVCVYIGVCSVAVSRCKLRRGRRPWGGPSSDVNVGQDKCEINGRPLQDAAQTWEGDSKTKLKNSCLHFLHMYRTEYRIEYSDYWSEPPHPTSQHWSCSNSEYWSVFPTHTL